MGPVLRLSRSASRVLEKWTEGVRSRFSANDLRRITALSPKIGPDPGFLNRLLAVAQSPTKIPKMAAFQEKIFLISSPHLPET